MDAEIDNNRGLDHGTFIPLKIMYPESNIPVIQISLVKGLDPLHHINIGRAIKEHLKENILLLGSGFSFHNMTKFDWEGKNLPDKQNDEFQLWLIDSLTGDYSRKEIEDKLVNWKQAPHARYCHPREEHLIPLAVCFGASEDNGRLVFDDYILG